jgi:hypothetical protein
MTIYGFQFFCDVSSGVGLCPYMGYGRGIPIYGDAATPRVFRVHKTDHSLLLMMFKLWNTGILAS